MRYAEGTPFYQLLATRYDAAREQEAIAILDQAPDLAKLEWAGPDRGHYAANDGKLQLIHKLIEHGADVNASGACWFRSVLAWAANNARLEAIQVLLNHGAKPDSLDALHAAAWGGSACGKGHEREFAETLKLLVEAGADVNDRRHHKDRTPLAVALLSGNTGAVEFLRSLHASEK